MAGLTRSGGAKVGGWARTRYSVRGSSGWGVELKCRQGRGEGFFSARRRSAVRRSKGCRGVGLHGRGQGGAGEKKRRRSEEMVELQPGGGRRLTPRHRPASQTNKQSQVVSFSSIRPVPRRSGSSRSVVDPIAPFPWVHTAFFNFSSSFPPLCSLLGSLSQASACLPDLPACLLDRAALRKESSRRRKASKRAAEGERKDGGGGPVFVDKGTCTSGRRGPHDHHPPHPGAEGRESPTHLRGHARTPNDLEEVGREVHFL